MFEAVIIALFFRSLSFITIYMIIVRNVSFFFIRTFNTKYAQFSSEEDLVRLIMNFPSFGGGLSGFSNNLQGTPHAMVHNFVGQHMATFEAPGKSVTESV
jgi:hypothetical protein